MGRTFLTLVAIALVAVFAVWAFDIDLSGDVELPEVNVSGGALPEAEIDTPEIDVEPASGTATVPDVDVEMEEERFTYPDVDITPPEDDSATEERQNSNAPR